MKIKKINVQEGKFKQRMMKQKNTRLQLLHLKDLKSCLVNILPKYNDAAEPCNTFLLQESLLCSSSSIFLGLLWDR